MSNNLDLYEKLNSENSFLENNWENEFKSGFLIMGIAKEKELNPEQCFDKMLGHFERAYINAPDENAKDTILTLSARMIDGNIKLIENLIENEKSGRANNNKEYLKIAKNMFNEVANSIVAQKDKLISLVGNSKNKRIGKSINKRNLENKTEETISENTPSNIADTEETISENTLSNKADIVANALIPQKIVVDIAIDLLPKIADEGEKFVTIWMENFDSKNRQVECYKQMYNMFIKILSSKYMPIKENQELKRAFQRNKVDILRYTIANGSISEANRLVSFEQDDINDMYSSARIIIEALCDDKRFSEAKSFLRNKTIKKLFDKIDYNSLWDLYENKKNSR